MPDRADHTQPDRIELTQTRASQPSEAKLHAGVTDDLDANQLCTETDARWCLHDRWRSVFRRSLRHGDGSVRWQIAK